MSNMTAYKETVEDIRWLLEDGSFESAEMLADALISKIEESEEYKKDIEMRRIYTPNQEVTELQLADIKDDEGARLLYHEMYLLKAESMGDTPECIEYLEKACMWAPAKYEIARSLIRACFDYELYDKGLEYAIKSFRQVSGKEKEGALLYFIRRMGEGCCWELVEEEYEGEDYFADNISTSVYEEDFKAYGIPSTAEEMRLLTDDDVEQIVSRCFPEKCEPLDMSPQSEIYTNDTSCPYCGDKKYFVERTGCSLQEETGKELYIEDGGPLSAICLRCRCAIEVPWVVKQNRKEEKDREKRNIELFLEYIKEQDGE